MARCKEVKLREKSLYMIEAVGKGEHGKVAWRMPDLYGYTTNLSKAGCFTEQEAARFCVEMNKSGNASAVMWTVEQVARGDAGTAERSIYRRH